jgi:2-dehydropantoate 2-reductase
MRYLVLGAGALGGYFGGMLLKGGADVTFLVRPARAAQLRRDGLVVKTQDGGELRIQAKTIQQGQVDGPYDVVLLCCKAYDLDGAMAAIAPAMGEQSVILPLLNGVRHIDALTERFGPGRVLGGLTVINAALMADGTIQQSQVRINLHAIGEFDGRTSPRCTAIKTALEAGGIPIQVSDSILAGMWMKFFGFACNATIATLTRSRAGTIARSACGASFVSAVIEECELWAVDTDRHGRRPTHRRRAYDWRSGGARGAGRRNDADPERRLVQSSGLRNKPRQSTISVTTHLIDPKPTSA